MTRMGYFSEYKGFTGSIFCDDIDKSYYGKLSTIGVEYYGKTLDMLYEQFKGVVDIHRRGMEPEKIIINSDGYYPICPNCYKEIETGKYRRDRPKYCGCGQELIWPNLF